jgi:hypothetical protein
VANKSAQSNTKARWSRTGLALTLCLVAGPLPELSGPAQAAERAVLCEEFTNVN